MMLMKKKRKKTKNNINNILLFFKEIIHFLIGKRKQIISILIIVATISFVLVSYYDKKIDYVTDRIDSFERNSLFKTNTLLLAGLYEKLETNISVDYAQFDYEIDGKLYSFDDLISHLLSNDFKLDNDDLINNVYMPELISHKEDRNGSFLIGFLSLFLALIISITLLTEDKKEKSN